MKRSVIIFLVLLTVFSGIWILKSRNPSNRPKSYSLEGANGNYWWEGVKAEEISTNWKLSEGVPDNYIPVPGMENIYMVVDEDGYIIGYKKGTKNENGEWMWEDINPDIPENYEAVPGLKDVYKVTYDDGSVRYFKYVRNQDDTYAFVEVDAKGNIIGMDEPSGGEIPENYEQVNRNQYAVKNENGIVIGYKERVLDNSSETGVSWINIDEPSSTNEDLDIKGVEFNLTKDATGKGDVTGGTKTITGYTGISSGDNDITSVPTLMPQLTLTGKQTTTEGNFVFTNPQQITTITQEQYFITAPPGIGDTSQIIATTEGKQQYQFSDELTQNSDMNPITLPTVNPSSLENSDYYSSANLPSTGNNLQSTEVSTSGGITYEEITYETKYEGNAIVTYATKKTTYYDEKGEAHTVTGTPEEVSRQVVSTSTAATSGIANTLSSEYQRMVDLLSAAGGKYLSSEPNEMVELLNYARGADGITTFVTFQGTSTDLYKLALCRATMMALTNSGNSNLSGYGTLSQMCSKYGISGASPSENMIIVNSGTSAQTIHNTFQSSSAKTARYNESYTQVAIVIVSLNGNYYVDEIFMK